jgi:hypothetical protein
MAESEQTESQSEEGGARGEVGVSMATPTDNSVVMKDWMLVAAGLERLFFSIYAVAFAIITSVYV